MYVASCVTRTTATLLLLARVQEGKLIRMHRSAICVGCRQTHIMQISFHGQQFCQTRLWWHIVSHLAQSYIPTTPIPQIHTPSILMPTIPFTHSTTPIPRTLTPPTPDLFPHQPRFHNSQARILSLFCDFVFSLVRCLWNKEPFRKHLIGIPPPSPDQSELKRWFLHVRSRVK